MTKLEGWKAKCFSKAGRTVLIQSHLESLPAHTMQCFSLPRKTTTGLNKIARGFFGKKSSTQHLIPTVSWDKSCRPKCHGGLGLQKAEATNKAFQCKLAWKILTDQQSSWVHSMKAKYLHQVSFLNYKMKPLDSPVWKSVTRSRDLLLDGLIWKIGNDCAVSFWFDN